MVPAKRRDSGCPDPKAALFFFFMKVGLEGRGWAAQCLGITHVSLRLTFSPGTYPASQGSSCCWDWFPIRLEPSLPNFGVEHEHSLFFLGRQHWETDRVNKNSTRREINIVESVFLFI